MLVLGKRGGTNPAILNALNQSNLCITDATFAASVGVPLQTMPQGIPANRDSKGRDIHQSAREKQQVKSARLWLRFAEGRLAGRILGTWLKTSSWDEAGRSLSCICRVWP